MIRQYLSNFVPGMGGALPAGRTSAADLTLKDLLDSDTKLAAMFESSFAFVSESATLADAKAEMERVQQATGSCNDVFVTRTGARAEPVVGWVTDNTIAANSRV